MFRRKFIILFKDNVAQIKI